MMGLITGKLWVALAWVGAVLALLGAALLRGRKQVQDELQDAYNTTTKDMHHEKSSRPVDADDVLNELHKYAKRRQRGGDS